MRKVLDGKVIKGVKAVIFSLKIAAFYNNCSFTIATKYQDYAGNLKF
jgi:hypothetical protein